MSDAHTRMTIRTTLERSGFTAEFIEDPEEALASCRTRRPDAMVVGSRLPKMDGFVFLYKLTGDGLAKVIPTILVAEAAETSRERMALSRGARGFIVKPVKVRKLLELVDKLTQGDRAKLEAAYQRQVSKLEEQDARAPEPAVPPATPQKPRKFVKKVIARKSSPQAMRSGSRNELLDKLRDEVRRLKRLPYHQRLELDADPRPDDVDASFRRLAMKYHPDRYKHHGKDARRLAQGVFMLLSDAKKALRPKATPAQKAAAPSSSDARRELPPRQSDLPRREASWTPQMIDLADIASSPEPDFAPELDTAMDDGVSPSGSESDGRISDGSPSDVAAADGPESHTATKPDERASGERVVPDDPPSKQRRAAFTALTEGRFRDAKNQLARLLDGLGEDEVDEELELALKLARGHLRWEEGFPEEAKDLFEEALSYDPESENALRSLRDVNAELEEKKSGLIDRLLGKR